MNASQTERRLSVRAPAFAVLTAAWLALTLASCVHPGAPADQKQAPRPLDPSERPYDEVGKWEADITAFEAMDQQSPPPPGSIVFIGSSSIVFWKTLHEDLAPLPVVNRGFGGSKIYDAVFYADRIVWPYKPRAIVMFSGSNDIVEPDANAPALVEQGVIDFTADTRAVYPNIDIHYISITPTRARWPAHPQVLDANRRLAALAERDPNFYFIDTASALMRNGEPDATFFVADHLHLNTAGYAAWTDVIRPHLMALYGTD